MNDLNSLVHALRKVGGFATAEQLEAVRPRLKNITASAVELVDAGYGVWDEAPDGSQQLRLTDKCLEMMASPAVGMTHEQLREALTRGDDLTGLTIFVRRN